ncbi:MAG: 4a-hydroxytetrahydrobiopterin dehydratase [Methylophilaceae bacterium]|jgi:4a-hydroxytetrahydrobiopterin dehydratase
MRLNDDEIRQALREMGGWSLTDTGITKFVSMHNWKGTMMLANAIAHLAEVAWHHPDMLVTFSGIQVTLYSHDEEGVTRKDIALATKIDELIGWNPKEEFEVLDGTPSSLEYRYIKNNKN